MKLLRILMLVVLLLALGLCVSGCLVVLFFPRERDALVFYLLKTQGIELQSLQDVEASLDKVTLGSATLTIDSSRLTVGGVTLTWDGTAVFNSVSTARIESVELAVAPGSDTRSPHTSSAFLHSLAERLLSLALPSFPVTISRVLVQSSSLPHPILFQDLRIEPTSEGHRAIAILGGYPRPFHLELALSTREKLLLQARIDDREAASLSLEAATPAIIVRATAGAAIMQVREEISPLLQIARAAFYSELNAADEALGASLELDITLGDLRIEGSTSARIAQQDGQAQLSIRPDLLFLTLNKEAALQLRANLSGVLEMPLSSQPPRIEGTLRLRDGSASYAGIEAQGINADSLGLRATLGEEPSLEIDPKRSLVHIPALRTGIDVDDLQFRPSFTYHPDRLDFSLLDLRARLLGGEITAPSVPLPVRPTLCTEAVVAASGVQLSAISALYNSGELDTSGELGGTVPLRLCQDGAVIDGAALQASAAGGHIRYHPSHTPPSMAGLDLALKILQDYQFKSLQVRAHLTKDGDLQLALSASGANPAVNKGHPVNVNLSVEENLPALLKSLRVGSQIAEKVARPKH
ncbi:MAG: YdbH domain-containing protein [Bdellovibrionota bacterium]|nr:MAG: YdbH domain-containing protein [Bdellovibrionota bacterium]